jgi:hypothetical protein
LPDRLRESTFYVAANVEGRLRGKRQCCIALARKYHPLVLERVRPMIEACDRGDLLVDWAREAADSSDSEFLKLLGISSSSLHSPGQVESRLDVLRDLCAAFARKYQPTVFEEARTAIEACDDPARLERWLLATADSRKESEYRELLGVSSPAWISSLYTAGEAEGRLEVWREGCVALARRYHPRVVERAGTVIDRCEDQARLEQWLLAAPDLSDSEFLKLLGA